MVNVLIVEDSPVQQALLGHILSSDSDITVIGTANDGREAVAFVNQRKPDIITMDLNMPHMNGLEATRRIMETTPVPIIIVSANWDPQEVAITFQAMEAGALAGVEKPRGLSHKDFATTAQQLVQTVKLMSEVKVIRRWPQLRPKSLSAMTPPDAAIPGLVPQPPAEVKLVVIGASTGGPPVLHTLLTNLPKNFSVPIAIVQHIAVGFLGGLVDWLSRASGLPVQVPTHGDLLLPGHVYLAPEGHHFGIERGPRAVVVAEPPENNLRPAVSFLFRSAAQVLGNHAVGVLLTGMGQDGAAELKLLRDQGAITIAQDKESSVVHGMPGEAIQLQGATHILPPDLIVELLAQLCRRPHDALEGLRQRTGTQS
jgi:two-component system, chemotaxis family, protein-glutamate methylesterase/glutaminase